LDNKKLMEQTQVCSNYLLFPKSNVLVGCGSADVAHSCQFADVQLPILMDGIVVQKGGEDVFFAPLQMLFWVFRHCNFWEILV